MKKSLLRIAVVLVVFLLVFAAIILLSNPEFFIKELPQVLALYHNTGDIHVTVDGKDIDLHETEISFDGYESATIKHNTFKFREGSYGDNSFHFIIPISDFGDVTVVFGHFNTNWWHQVHYTLTIDISTNEDGTYTASTTQKVALGGEERFTHQATDILSKENSKISILICP